MRLLQPAHTSLAQIAACGHPGHRRQAPGGTQARDTSVLGGHACSPWGSAEWAQATQQRTVRKPPSSQKASLAACGAASKTASSSAAAARAARPPSGASTPSRMRALFSSRRSAACMPFACLCCTAGPESSPNSSFKQSTVEKQ